MINLLNFRRGALLAGLTFGLFCPPVFSSARAADLRVYNWANYIAPETLEGFESQTGLEISYHTYNSLAELETLLALMPAPPPPTDPSAQPGTEPISPELASPQFGDESIQPPLATPGVPIQPATPPQLAEDPFAQPDVGLALPEPALPEPILSELGGEPAPTAPAAQPFDVLILPAWRAAELVEAGLVAVLEQAKLSRFVALDPLLVQWLPLAPPGQTYALPYLWGTAGLAWDKNGPGSEVVSWQALLDPEQAGDRARCGIGLADEAGDLLAAGLFYDAQPSRWAREETPDEDEADPEAEEGPRTTSLAGAEARIAAAAPYIKGFFSSWEAARALTQGDLCIAQLRAPDLYRLVQSGAADPDRFAYAVPEEGARGWMDVAIIAPGADNAAAYQWLNFLMQAPVAAANAAAAGHGAVVVDAQEFLPAGAADNQLLAPPARARLAPFAASHADAQAVHARLKAWIEAGRP